MLNKKVKIGLFAALSGIAFLGSMWANHINQAKAAENNNGTVDIRIIATTDLHGQVTSRDYEQGVNKNNFGLAKAFNLIKTARSEVPKANSITLDAGDVLYDYTTEYIFGEDQNVIQPIYKAMAKVGYDAITLGNHDFEYGYDYILRQLSETGMKNVTVLSNVTDSKTGKYPFHEYKMITRKVKTSTGKTVEIKIGIIGQTIPTLSSKTQSYVGILKTEDFVLNAQKQAKKLKEMGADIVVALSHTGIGPEKPELNFKNEAYALSKISNIDVVVCGHEHMYFPTEDPTSTFFRLPNVSKKTFLMNGKNVIMAGNRGSAIGVVDLKLQVDKNSTEIVNRSSQIRKVDSKVNDDTTIASTFGDWDAKINQYSNKILGHLDKDDSYQNYYGMLEDTAAIQVLNDSKINYAQRYVNTTGTKYKDYPIIAASTYTCFGADSVDNFINLKGDVTEASINEIQPYNSYLYLYKINGKQLKEWLEWSASAYESTVFTKKWNNIAMSDLMTKTNLKSLLREEWLDDWGNFYIFDGIDYQIDPSAEPRYDLSGNKISQNERVKNITYNGKNVTDDTVLLLAINKITHPVTANAGVDKKVVLNGFNRSQMVLSNYLKQLSVSGSLMPEPDYNWSLDLPKDYKFIVKVPYYADSLFTATKWYNSFLDEKEQYRYYSASSPGETTASRKPHIVITPLKTNVTASPYDVAVQAYGDSEIKQLLILPGECDVNEAGWLSAKVISNHIFTVYENGVFSVYAEDINGNKTVKKFVVSNFNKDMLSTPTVNSYTNRKTKITGTAEPGTTIVFEANTGTYESKVGDNGNFSYALPSQTSGSTISVYIKNQEKGLESERITFNVKRTGPNQPSVLSLGNNDDCIMGRLNDDDASVIAIIGDKVYVSSKGGKELWKANTEIYSSKYKIVQVKEDVSSTLYYKLMIPTLHAGTKVTIYTLDHISRNSRSVTTKVIDKAPNMPVVYEISNIEKELYGYIPSYKKVCDVTVKIGDQTFKTATNNSGRFTIPINHQLHVDDELTITASDTKDGVVRNSRPVKVRVLDIEKFVKKNSSELTFNRITNKSNYISGNYSDSGTVYVAITAGKGKTFKNTMHVTEADSTTRFSYELTKKLKVGYTIYAMIRFTDGKILLANKTVVLQGIPDTPKLLRQIKNTDKTAKVITDKNCKVTLKVGSRIYTTSKYKLDADSGDYIYTFDINRASSGINVAVKAQSTLGSSDYYHTEIEKVAPDKPQVNKIKHGDMVITGKVDLVDDSVDETDAEVIDTDETDAEVTSTDETDTQVTDSNETNTKVTDTNETDAQATDTKDTDAEDSWKEKVPKRFKDAPEMVAKTETRIFAQIGKKIYEGKINKNGSFKIKVPKQTKGTIIYVWGSNKSGRGPLEKMKVE